MLSNTQRYSIPSSAAVLCATEKHPRFGLQSWARKYFIFIVSLLCS